MVSCAVFHASKSSEEVNPRSSPPTCKLLDFGKYKYEAVKQAAQEKRESEEGDDEP